MSQIDWNRGFKRLLLTSLLIFTIVTLCFGIGEFFREYDYGVLAIVAIFISSIWAASLFLFYTIPFLFRFLKKGFVTSDVISESSQKLRQELFFEVLKWSIIISFAGIVLYLLMLAANSLFCTRGSWVD